MRNIIAVKGIFFQDDVKKILLVKQRNEKWELPGGKLEPNETLRIGLEREINEELGINCIIEYLLDIFPYQVTSETTLLIFVYKLTFPGEHITLSSEHTDYAWFSLDQLSGIQMPTEYRNCVTTFLAKSN